MTKYTLFMYKFIGGLNRKTMMNKGTTQIKSTMITQS